MITKCKACGAPIMWIRTKAGKSMPVDATPVHVANGGTQIFITIGGKTIMGHPLNDEDDPENWIRGYVPHWATCPNAKQFRKK